MVKKYDIQNRYNYNLHKKSNKNDFKTPLIIVAGIALRD